MNIGLIHCPVCGHQDSLLSDACQECGSHQHGGKMTIVEIITIVAAVITLTYIIITMTS